MKNRLASALALALAAIAISPPAAADRLKLPAPSEVVAQAPASDWVKIAPSDLLVMDLAPDARGKPRRIIIQLMPPPFSQGWIANIRKLVAARWFDGASINRVQDNYVVQWGDPDGEDAARAKKLPGGLRDVARSAYVVERDGGKVNLGAGSYFQERGPEKFSPDHQIPYARDPYHVAVGFEEGWPIAMDTSKFWPVHCYGMIGVGRGLVPDTGTGAELYTVIGHAPRHLDRNIALVGRVIEGIEHLSSLPRGTGPLGFYENPAERVPIVALRPGAEIAGLPVFEYLSTKAKSFRRYAEARANRRDDFFIEPAGGADVCNIPVPIRRAP